MTRIRHAAAGLLVAAALICPAHATVNDASANGFSVTETVHVAALPARVYEALIAPQNWWSAAHTFSKNAANLSLDAHAGGCWCEKLPDGGSVQHLIVVYADPGKALRLRGALGPLQGLGVDGALTVTLKPEDGGTSLVLSYNIGGYMKDGLGGLANPVDSVLGEQAARLKSFVETGSPEAKGH
jgi:uncharacterized protein YndB with AHSA1/START domain